jgi:hypothetical protein
MATASLNVPPSLLTERNLLGDCEDIKNIYSVIARFSATRRPGTYLVDTFPELANYRIFDFLSSWRKDGAEVHKLDSEIYREYWNRMKKEIENKNAAHSWGKGFVQSDYTKHGVDELGAIYAAYFPYILFPLSVSPSIFRPVFD